MSDSVCIASTTFLSIQKIIIIKNSFLRGGRLCFVEHHRSASHNLFRVTLNSKQFVLCEFLLIFFNKHIIRASQHTL